MMLRIAPGVRLASTADGLRVDLNGGKGRVATVTELAAATALPSVTGKNARGGARAEPVDVSRVSLKELEQQVHTAALQEDVAALQTIEDSLTTMHRVSFPQRRRPVVEGPVPLTSQERSAARKRAIRGALAGLPFFGRSVRSEAKAQAVRHAEDFVQASQVARAIAAQHRQAVVDDTWYDLAEHHPATVIEAVERTLRETATDCTCVDAGRLEGSTRTYVTVILTFASPELVRDRGPGMSPTGRRMMRRRTRAERNAVYLTALASMTLATVKHVISVAVAADDVNLVIVRRTGAAAGALEPIYVGSLSREAVTLRPPQADPVPLFLSAAMREMRFEGSAHDLIALEVDDELADIIATCERALADAKVDAVLNTVRPRVVRAVPG
jgi:hypothetical protein